MDSTKYETVCRFVPPTNQTELKSFSETCNVYCRFVPELSRLAASLHVRTGNYRPSEVKLIVAEFGEFQKLRERLISLLILALRQHEQCYTLDTDACEYRKRCAL